MYGLIGYSGVIMLIASAFREVPDKQAHSIARVIWLIPSMAAIMVLAGSGVNINLDSEGETITEIYNGTTGLIMTNTTSYQTLPDQITLVNPMWILFHSMLGLIMAVYIFIQLMTLLGKT